jgi:oligopeptide transport system ATP-binding protein
LPPPAAPTPAAPPAHLLEVRDLTTTFNTDLGTITAVDGVSYDLDAGEALAIVGESGSGKTVAALSLIGLVPPPGSVEHGEVILHGRNLLDLSAARWRRVRGRKIAMIFQDPMTSLNPVLSIGSQVTESLTWHESLPAAAARSRAIELLELVGIPHPAERLSDYPHQLSGGQRQRLMIAMALSCDPSVLIADEPTTALDVTIQAQIIDLVEDLRRRLGMAIIWITHDLAVVAGLVDRVAVMYAGHIVEQAPVGEIFRRPRHPYTLGLLRSMPSAMQSRSERLAAIPGHPPDPSQPTVGCPFAPRCAYVADRCHQELPPLVLKAPDHSSACWQAEEVAATTATGREA